MKHAILITAYKDFDQLFELVKLFGPKFNIYIHVDKKTDVSNESFDKIKNSENVKYIGQDYQVNWGGLNHLLAYLHLSKLALSDSSNGYFHLITGQDVVVKGERVFEEVERSAKDYISYFTMPAARWKYGGMHRLQHFNFNDIVDHKKYRLFHLILTRLQARLDIKRKLPQELTVLYGGSTYWSLTRETLEYVINTLDSKPKLMKRLKMTLCAEEIIFQTIILNSYRRDNVVNDGLRYIDWKSGRGGLPAFLDESDFSKIMKSNALFARKVDMHRNSLFNSIVNGLNG